MISRNTNISKTSRAKIVSNWLFLEISTENNNENLYFKNLINFLKSHKIEDKFNLSNAYKLQKFNSEKF